jgi:prepilin-type N-terminal cleavage/methylation domain-containing protein
MTPPRSCTRAGFSLIEVLVAVVILGVSLVAVASMGTVSAGRLRQSRTDLAVWSVMQRTSDSLRAVTTSVTSGSKTINQVLVTWTVRDSLSPKRVDMVVKRNGLSVDTTIFYLGGN